MSHYKVSVDEKELDILIASLRMYRLHYDRMLLAMMTGKRKKLPDGFKDRRQKVIHMYNEVKRVKEETQKDS